MPDLMRKRKLLSRFFSNGGVYDDTSPRHALYAQQCPLVALDLPVNHVKSDCTGDIRQPPASI